MACYRKRPCIGAGCSTVATPSTPGAHAWVGDDNFFVGAMVLRNGPRW